MTNVQSEIKDDQIVPSSEYRVSRKLFQIFITEKNTTLYLEYEFLHDGYRIDAFLADITIDGVIHSPSYPYTLPRKFYIFLHLDSTK